MAAVFRRQGADKGRAPAGREAVLRVQCAQAAKAGVDDPERVATVVGQLMDVNVAGDVEAPGEITGVMRAHRLEFVRHGGHIVVIPHRVAAPNGEAARVSGKAHGLGKGSEMRVEDAVVVPRHNDFARLVGGDHQADAQLGKEARQVGGMHATQVSVWQSGRGRSHGRHLLSHVASQHHIHSSAILETILMVAYSIVAA